MNHLSTIFPPSFYHLPTFTCTRALHHLHLSLAFRLSAPICKMRKNIHVIPWTFQRSLKHLSTLHSGRWLANRIAQQVLYSCRCCRHTSPSVLKCLRVSGSLHLGLSECFHPSSSIIHQPWRFSLAFTKTCGRMHGLQLLQQFEPRSGRLISTCSSECSV